jgi:UDP-N-acetylmuramoyl-L-alanyl-D-glutamate--2,6-diaminopimelate ligase
MNLAELIKDVHIREMTGETTIDIKGLTKDSREVGPGFMFFATERAESFIDQARQRGARVVMSERQLYRGFEAALLTDDIKVSMGNIASRFFQFPSEKISVIGVTGTNGKTTITYLIESIMKAAGKKTGVIGTISYRYDGHTLKAPNTTPGAIELQELLGEMRNTGAECVVMEVSSHALHQARVTGVHFDACIFTNLTHDHLDYHGDFEHYRQAKALLFHQYLTRSAKAKKYAVLNSDDGHAGEFMPPFPVETFYYSTTGKADASLIDCSETVEGLSLHISLAGSPRQLVSPLIGMFNVSNILAASLCSHVLGIPWPSIQEGVETLKGVPGRLERVGADQPFAVFVDYAHTPDALERVLGILRRLKKGRLILVFGCGGDRDKAKRPLMGSIAANLADFTIITSDNPRTEDPGSIIEEIRAGFGGQACVVVGDRREAIFEGVRRAREDDILLVAGKGHEDYQVLGTRVIHFSDREVIEEALHVAA